MKIAIEGMDGVGKTTISKLLAEELNYVYIDKPLHYFFEDGIEKDYQDLMKAVNKVSNTNDPIIRSWFIGLGNLFSFRKFSKENTIIDRHFVSNYYWNGSEESDLIFKTMIDLVGKPDLTILLYASPETRIQRLRMRNPEDEDLKNTEKLADGYPKMIEFVEKFGIPNLLINTENKTINDIKEEVKLAIFELDNSQKRALKKGN